MSPPETKRSGIPSEDGQLRSTDFIGGVICLVPGGYLGFSAKGVNGTVCAVHHWGCSLSGYKGLSVQIQGGIEKSRFLTVR